MAEVRAARPGEANYASTDIFSLHHMMFGALMGAAGASALQALAATVVWETVEPALKRAYPDMFPSNTTDTVSNKMGDSTFWMMGWFAGAALRSADDR